MEDPGSGRDPSSVEANAVANSLENGEGSKVEAAPPPAAAKEDKKSKKKGRAPREKLPAVKFGALFRYASSTDILFYVVACIGAVCDVLTHVRVWATGNILMPTVTSYAITLCIVEA